MPQGVVIELCKSAEPPPSGLRSLSQIVHSRPLASVPQVHVVPGRGVEGDRYFLESWPQLGSDNRGPLVRKELTLIEAEVIEDVCRVLGRDLPYIAFRRQVVTRGISLAELVGQQITIGGVLVRGVKVDEGCLHLEQVVGVPGLLRALAGRGGLRAQILTEGHIRVGDPVKPLVAASTAP